MKRLERQCKGVAKIWRLRDGRGKGGWGDDGGVVAEMCETSPVSMLRPFGVASLDKVLVAAERVLWTRGQTLS